MNINKIVTCKLSEVSQKLYRKMYSLNYSRVKISWGQFYMRSILSRHRRRKDDTLVHYILDEDDNLAAWALTFYEEGYGPAWRPGWNAHFYTRAKYRRQGLGTKLAAEIKVLKLVTRFHPWDSRSRGFFNYVENNL